MKQHPDLARLAPRAWRYVFGCRWPRGWRVVVCRTQGFLGMTVYMRKTIIVSNIDPAPLATLAHEFVHLRWPRLRHGREFEARSAEISAMLGLRPSVDWLRRPDVLSPTELRIRMNLIEDVADEVREDYREAARASRAKSGTRARC